MKKKDPFPRFPVKFRVSLEQSKLWYTRLHGMFAVHKQVSLPMSSSVLFFLDEGKIAIFQGDPDDLGETIELESISPVYSLQSDGPPAVPTGLIFVRFKDDTMVKERLDHILQAGYDLVQILSYAPNAAWVRSTQAGIAGSFLGIEKLESLPDIVNVEPQMLSERVMR